MNTIQITDKRKDGHTAFQYVSIGQFFVSQDVLYRKMSCATAYRVADFETVIFDPMVVVYLVNVEITIVN